MKKASIPSDETFARAKRLMEQDLRGLDEVFETIRNRFSSRSWFHNVYVLPQRDVDFRAFVFFKRDSDLATCSANGLREVLEAAVCEEIERVGRGKLGEITIAFEYDSDENVNRKYGGDYMLRLR